MARYRRSAGFELPAGSREDAGPEKIFVISDLHLGHENIIRYCSRPFVHHDPAEMDAVLIRNWNACVRPGDRVIFLGDLLYGKPALPAEDYVKQLNGRITFVSGNHDNPGFSGSVPSCCMTFEDIPFLFIHDPADAPTGFSGWIIHGHHHNNDLRQFPFIDYENRTVNVSAEVVGYVPVDLREICRLVQSRSEQNTNDPLLLRYPHVKDPGQGSR
ncbi:MAG: metallophosphoesterase, partial [Methanoregula sp.]|nr:metallophosphoesterase [Methanoregula sp.]